MPATWDTPGLTWDRADLAWDLPADWLIIPYLFGPASVAETPWLDADFAAVVTHSNTHKDPSMAVLSVPSTFSAASLHTPTVWLDANFTAVFEWMQTWPPGVDVPEIPPYAFRSAGQHTPLSRLDANFAAIADWWNAP